MTSLAERAGRWSAAHRKTAILGWILFVVAASVLGGMAGFSEQDSDDGIGSSGRADRALSAAFPDRPTESVLVEGDDPPVEDVSRRLRAAQGVKSVALARRSGDGRSVLLTVALDDDDSAVALTQVTDAAAREHPGVYVGQFGEASVEAGIDDAMGADMAQAEMFSIPLTLILLLLSFGSLVAAAVPLLLALSAVGAAVGVVSLLSHLVVMDETVNSVVLLVGLAVGVDYSLFYLRRAREERDGGRDPGAALRAAAATSGHAVLVSGLTVMIAMAGMFLAGSAIFTALAIGSIIVVAVALLASVTVLPAVLSALGDRIERGRVPGLRRRRQESRIWSFVLDRVLRRPAVAAVVSAGVLVALAIPALGMDTALPTMSSVPGSVAGKQAWERIEAAFPGDAAPATVAVRADDVTEAPVRAAIADLAPTAVRISPDQRVAAVDVPLAEGDLQALRDRVGQVAATTPGMRADVAGEAAGSADFEQLMRDRAPLVFAFVLGLAFVLLLITFRSVVIPLKAIVLNLLSVGAAYGVLALAYDEPITAWLPMFEFVILFGLSMDYHVFIVSRIRELRLAGASTRDAVSGGIRATAGVVTSAAAIMVAVFGAFGTVSSIEMQQMGVGLAAAVLIDATLIRAVLLPAAMVLLGEWNWWLPRRRRVAAPHAVAQRAAA
jgi:uncharacterized membrane protein YdfJ with MMPL/SSD domain